MQHSKGRVKGKCSDVPCLYFRGADWNFEDNQQPYIRRSPAERERERAAQRARRVRRAPVQTGGGGDWGRVPIMGHSLLTCQLVLGDGLSPALRWDECPGGRKSRETCVRGSVTTPLSLAAVTSRTLTCHQLGLSTGTAFIVVSGWSFWERLHNLYWK